MSPSQADSATKNHYSFRQSPWLPASLLLGFHLLVGATFVVLFSRANQWGGWKYRLIFVAYHWVVNAGIWLVILGSCGWLLQAEMGLRWPGLRRVGRLLPGLAFLLLTLLWFVDWVTTQQWGGNISDQLLWEIARHWQDYRRLLPGKVYALILLGVTLAFWGYLQLSKRLLPGFTGLVQHLCAQTTRKRWLILTGVVLGYVLLFALLWHPWLVKWNYWQREPLVSLFLLSRGHLLFPEQAQAFLPATPRRTQNAERDRQLRQTYPKVDIPKRNVILITVDSWRADHLPFYGYSRQTSPFLSQLVTEGRLKKVAEARATCNATYCAVLSVLASRTVPDLGAGLFQLQDVLSAQGYKIHFLLSGVHTAWYNLRQLYGTSIDTYFDGTLARNYVANDDRGVLEELAKVPMYQTQPAFFYFHLMAPHLVGVRLPEYAEWQPVSAQLRRYNDATVNLNTYDNGVRMADAMIEQIFATLAVKGYLRDSIAIILGDHGEALGEHHNYSHGLGLYEEDLRIPFLLLDEPSQAYRNLTSAVQLDVAPTLLDRVGLPIPSSWQGKSLLRAEPPATSYHQAGFQPQQAVIHCEGEKVWKYILTRSTQAEELYELRADPQELQNLAGKPTTAVILSRLRALLAQQ